jgi:hypothetical protein
MSGKIWSKCNTIMILIILLSILLLAIIWYKKQQYEYFQDANKERLAVIKSIQTYIMLGNIDDMYTIPNIQHEIDVNFNDGKITIVGGKEPLRVDENTYKSIAQTIVACINDTNCKGVNMFMIVSEPDKFSKLFIYPTRGTNTDINHNTLSMSKVTKDNLFNKLNIKGTSDTKNYYVMPYSLQFTSNKDMYFKDNTNTYQVYMNKVVPSSVKSEKIEYDFNLELLGIDFSTAPFLKNPTKDNFIKLFGDELCNNKELQKALRLNGSFCETFSITISTNNKITFNIYTDKADPSKFEKMPDNLIFSIIYSKNKYQEPTNKLSNLTGKCANVTLKSKDIGKDCFGQLWAENKCSNPIPEYNDDFKALSYEEIAKEIKDSNCYTRSDWKKTSYRLARNDALQSTRQTNKADDEIDRSELSEKQKEPIKNNSFFDKTKYILKTMLMPSQSVPKYDKKESIKSTEKKEINTKEKNDNNTESNTIGISLYELKI